MKKDRVPRKQATPSIREAQDLFSAFLSPSAAKEEVSRFEQRLPDILKKFEAGRDEARLNLTHLADLVEASEQRSQEMAGRKWFKAIWSKLDGSEAQDKKFIESNLKRVQASSVLVMNRLMGLEEYRQEALQIVQARMEKMQVDQLRRGLILEAVLNYHDQRLHSIEDHLDMVSEKVGLPPLKRKSPALLLFEAIEKAKQLRPAKTRAPEPKDVGAFPKSLDYSFLAQGVAHVNPNQGGVWSIAFSPDASLLASGHENDSAVLWKVDSSGKLVQLGNPISVGETVRAVRFSPDGKLLAIGDDNGYIWLFDPATGLKQKFDELPRWKVWALAFHPTRPWLGVAINGKGGKSKKELHLLGIHEFQGMPPKLARLAHWNAPDDVNALAFSPDGSLLTFVDDDNMVHRVQLPESIQWGQQIPSTASKIGKDCLFSVDFHPEEFKAALGTDDDLVLAVDLAHETPRPVETFTSERNDEVWTVKFSPCGRFLLGGDGDGRLFILKWPSGQKVFDEALHPDEIHSLDVSRDGRLIATGSQDGSIKISKVAG